MTISCWSVIEAVCMCKKIMVTYLNELIVMLVIVNARPYFTPFDPYSSFPLFYTKALNLWSVLNRSSDQAYE